MASIPNMTDAEKKDLVDRAMERTVVELDLNQPASETQTMTTVMMLFYTEWLVEHGFTHQAIQTDKERFTPEWNHLVDYKKNYFAQIEECRIAMGVHAHDDLKFIFSLCRLLDMHEAGALDPDNYDATVQHLRSLLPQGNQEPEV